MKKILRWPTFLVLAALIAAALIPTIPLFHPNKTSAVHAQGPAKGPLFPTIAHHPKPRPHHTTAGVDRTHLQTLTILTGPVQHAGTNKTHPQGAFVDASIVPNSTTTLFFDDMENGTNGWTTVGDTYNTSYYPNGHDFWNLVQNPHNLAVLSAVNPTLVSYPDTTGKLPIAYSGTHAWWYGDNPAADLQNPSGASITYMGNQGDWPYPEGAGGTSNSPNTAALISPSIDLTSASNATLTFATWWEIESANPAHFDMMYIDVSKDGGNTWTSLGVLNPTQNPAGGSDAYPYSDSGLDAPASWQIVSADLTPYVGSHVQVRFHFNTVDQIDNGFRGWLLDDVGVYSKNAGSPIVTSVVPTSGMVGNTVTISGTGFGSLQNNSTVTFKGVTAQVQSWSDSTIVVTVPVGAVSGSMAVTINGIKIANIGFTVNASLSISSPATSPGTAVSFSGTGFVANEVVNVYLNGVTGILLTSATTDANGNLATPTATVPHMPGGKHLVLAVGQTSHITGGATLSIVPTISTSTSTAQPLQYIGVTGAGFAANENVTFYVDNIYTYGNISTDGQGNLSGSIRLDFTNAVYGQHVLFGIGYSSTLVAQTPLFLTSALAGINPTSGGPGSTVTLQGAAFAQYDVVEVYWGTTAGTFMGTARADIVGSFYFNVAIPAGVAAGQYTITGLSRQTGAVATVQFSVPTPVLQLFAAGIQPGQQVQASLRGFQAKEQVAISWNANGGQQITTLTTYSDGSSYGSITFPSAPSGGYTISATGVSSGLQATSNVNVGPGILITPFIDTPGSTITVTGGGYTANENVNVYIQQTSNGVVKTTTDASGAFTVSLKIPRQIQSSYATVYAVSATGTDSANAQLQIVAPSFYDISCCGFFGSPTSFAGQRFAPDEKINILWNYQQTDQVKIGEATADNSGAFSVTLVLPSAPGTSAWTNNVVNVVAVGRTSGLVGIANVYLYPEIILTPSHGPAGTKVHISGGDFGASEMVTVSYQGIVVATVTTNQHGAFATAFTVPKAALIGNATIRATGGTTVYNTSANFIVTPTVTINPTTGTSGTTITVTGLGFTPSGNVYISWYDPGTGSVTYLGNVSATSTGTFSTTIKAPGGLTSGNTYYVQGYDITTQISGYAAFVAQ